MRCVAFIAVLLAGCLVRSRSTPAPNQPPSRGSWVAGFGARLAAVTPSDSGDDGADGTGPGYGLRGGPALRVHPRIAVGICLDFLISGHRTPDPELGMTYWMGSWGLTGRAELHRTTIEAWGSWYFAHRLLDDDRDDWGAVSSLNMQGPAIGAAWMWRWTPRTGPSFEIGPVVQVAWLRVIEDELGMPVDDGVDVRSLSLGLTWQMMFGAAP